MSLELVTTNENPREVKSKGKAEITERVSGGH